ncbi:MAG: META domain-containing protein [Rhodocyclaceae bacterium]
MTFFLRTFARLAPCLFFFAVAHAHAQSPLQDFAATTPASFSGVLPCADCGGQRYRLNLFDNGAYALQIDYLGVTDNDHASELGRWTVAPGGRTLVLESGNERPLRFAIEAGGLRMLDMEGKPIRSRLNYVLRRDTQFSAVTYRGNLRGTYTRVGDDAVFEECGSGIRLPVVELGDYQELASRYARARPAPNTAMVATVEGRITSNTVDQDQRPGLLVERFLGIWPGETCGTRTTAHLVDTYWQLTRLGNAPVRMPAGQRPPYLTLLSEGRLTGSGGCNLLNGHYTLAGNALAFAQVAGTEMACMNGMDQESRFVNALAQVYAWRIDGEHLELLDRGGNPLARFEAAALR